MGGIFISYRRIDSKPYSGRLFDRLARHFGRLQIFMDIEGGIARGEDFAEALERAVKSVDAMVVVVGRQWLVCADDAGRRRLDIPGDWVRGEIAAGLARGILLLPVLVDGASMPRPGDLPEDIAPFARKQAAEISDSRWDYDVAQIFKVLEQAVSPQPESDERPSPWAGRVKRIVRWVGWGLAGALAALVVAVTVSVTTETRPGDYRWTVDPPQVRFVWDRASNEPRAINVTITNTGRKAAAFRLSLGSSQLSPGVLAIKDDTCGTQAVPTSGTCTAKLVFAPQWFNGVERDRDFDGEITVAVPNKSWSAIPLSIRSSAP